MPSATWTMLQRTLIALLLIITLLGTSTCRAADCDKVIETCDRALAAKDKQIRLCDLALAQSIERGGQLTFELRQKDEQLSAWYRNPFTMATIGVLLGIVATGIALK